jgi:hypothetical protein
MLNLFFGPEDEGNMFLRNVGRDLSYCTVLQPRRSYNPWFEVENRASLKDFIYHFYPYIEHCPVKIF